MTYRFEWDPTKASKNLEKHEVSFENAATVFQDPHALTIFDQEHSSDEERWITLGLSGAGTLIVVIHTYTVETKVSAVLRIITARKANRHETGQYHG